jgi:hypothetical protein
MWQWSTREGTRCGCWFHCVGVGVEVMPRFWPSDVWARGSLGRPGDACGPWSFWVPCAGVSFRGVVLACVIVGREGNGFGAGAGVSFFPTRQVGTVVVNGSLEKAGLQFFPWRWKRTETCCRDGGRAARGSWGWKKC